MKDKAEFLPNSAWYLRLENQQLNKDQKKLTAEKKTNIHKVWGQIDSQVGEVTEFQPSESWLKLVENVA